MKWAKMREAQHYARFPPGERRERNRLAQARYRKRHGKALTEVRAITNFLLRQSYTYPHDIKRLAAALRDTLDREGMALLRRELGRS
jgi:hypothetical protein